MNLAIDIVTLFTASMIYVFGATVVGRAAKRGFRRHCFTKYGYGTMTTFHKTCTHDEVGWQMSGAFWPLFLVGFVMYKAGRIPYKAGVVAEEHVEHHRINRLNLETAPQIGAAVDHDLIAQLEESELYTPIKPEVF